MPMSPRLLRPRTAAAGTATFSPQTLSGLAIWLDASNNSTLTLNGNGVSEWRDLSGNGRHYAQATAANQPLATGRTQNNLRVIDFVETSSHWLTGNSATLDVTRNINGLTIFAVAAFDVFGTSQRPVWFASTGTSSASTRASLADNVTGVSVSGRRLDSDSFQSVQSGSTLTSAGVYCAALDYANSDAFIFSGGTSLASSLNFQTSGNTSDINSVATSIGYVSTGSVYFDGMIGEIVVYRRFLAATERQAIERYLGAKWGLTVA